MLLVKFKNLDPSEFAKTAVEARIEELIAKFPDLNGSRILVTLEMQNSPLQGGPDVFGVKLIVDSGRYKGVAVEKKDINLYSALANLDHRMLERLNRFGDRKRVRERNQARRLLFTGSNFKRLKLESKG